MLNTHAALLGNALTAEVFRDECCTVLCQRITAHSAELRLYTSRESPRASRQKAMKIAVEEKLQQFSVLNSFFLSITHSGNDVVHCGLLTEALFSSSNTDVTVQNHLRIIHPGDSVNFTCILSGEIRSSMVWVRQRVGEKPLLIASIYQALDVKFENEFDKYKRFFVTKDNGSFNLSITNAEESDTATYYCVTYAYKFIFGKGTDLIVKGGELSIDSDHQRPAPDPEHPEESAVALQCAVVTQSCAGEHNVYWFRDESGESPPGIIYTQERRNGQCERSSDGNSTTHKCIYNLPKNSLSHSDAGIYYCAVAACGEILFGDKLKVNLPGAHFSFNKKGFH
ncbi:uncharacterized protein LOC127515618 [Ctenopharyngodon idella]|uniref:uncharacterized protein LOC127515618 n=1 Tax=Ctenopharyngodon idella TaxID=7959 RepID=UPI00222E9AD1|nr:uncharacterized protein LOC127515618 [Ctenopharyngodon idella]